jgi:hypothetical protein
MVWMSAAGLSARGFSPRPDGKGGIGAVRDDPFDAVILQEPCHLLCVVHGPVCDFLS